MVEQNGIRHFKYIIVNLKTFDGPVQIFKIGSWVKAPSIWPISILGLSDRPTSIKISVSSSLCCPVNVSSSISLTAIPYVQYEYWRPVCAALSKSRTRDLKAQIKTFPVKLDDPILAWVNSGKLGGRQRRKVEGPKIGLVKNPKYL